MNMNQKARVQMQLLEKQTREEELALACQAFSQANPGILSVIFAPRRCAVVVNDTGRPRRRDDLDAKRLISRLMETGNYEPVNLGQNVECIMRRDYREFRRQVGLDS